MAEALGEPGDQLSLSQAMAGHHQGVGGHDRSSPLSLHPNSNGLQPTSNLLAMASNLLAMASNLLFTKLTDESNCFYQYVDSESCRDQVLSAAQKQ